MCIMTVSNNYIVLCYTEKYSTFNASNLVTIISKSSESQTDVMLSLKYYFGLTVSVSLHTCAI